jgi:hypothetical protein
MEPGLMWVGSNQERLYNQELNRITQRWRRLSEAVRRAKLHYLECTECSDPYLLEMGNDRQTCDNCTKVPLVPE